MKIDKELEKQNIEKILGQCYVQLVALGIPVAPRKNITLKMCQRMSVQAYCELLPGKKYEIQLPESCYKEPGSKCETRSRILHELLHTCPGCFDHGPKYMEYRKRVQNALHYDVLSGVDDPASIDLPTIMAFTCPSCNCTTEYKKRSKKNLERPTEIPKLYEMRGYISCGYCETRIPFKNIVFYPDVPEDKKNVAK